MRARRDRDITNLRLRNDWPSPPVKPAKDNGVVALFLLLTWLSFATPIVVVSLNNNSSKKKSTDTKILIEKL